MSVKAVNVALCPRGKMNNLFDFPSPLFVFSFIALWFSAYFGTVMLKKLGSLDVDGRQDVGVIQAAALTLLGLLIGFTFSMAMNRYEQRKNYEEAEANAIGTEYVRVGLLPAADATRLRDLLRNYLHQRLLFYTARDAQHLQPNRCRHCPTAGRTVVRGPDSRFSSTDGPKEPLKYSPIHKLRG